MSSSSATGRQAGEAARLGLTGRAETDAPVAPRAPAEAPPLRLVGDQSGPAAPTRTDQPLTGATDPRWVLAVRTAEQLEGAVLSPEKRQRLLRLGRVMGLTPFDCNLVIAIVQDQARRGHAPEGCPAAGESQLQMVPLPTPAGVVERLRRRPAWLATALVLTAVLVELALLQWIF